MSSYLSEQELVYYADNNETFYFLQPYNNEHLKLIDNNDNIYNVDSNLSYHQVWNIFDEIGLLYNLKRLPKESNKEFKARILDKAKKPSDSTKQGLSNHIARELGVGTEEVSINKIADDDFIEQYRLPNGTVKEELIGIADRINKRINIFWNDAIWDESYWDTTEKQEFRYIPYQVDR